MAGAKITVDDSAIIAALQGLIAAGERPEPALKNIGEHLRESTIARIKAEKSPDGTAFKPLSPAYAKTKKGPGILRETGTLAQIVYQAADGQLDVGTNAIYAAIHQFGGSVTRHARSRQMSFRTASEGAFTKKDGTKAGSKLRFAAPGSPGSSARWVTIGEHTIPIPARPFLGISAEDKVAVLEILGDFLDLASGDNLALEGRPLKSGCYSAGSCLAHPWALKTVCSSFGGIRKGFAGPSGGSARGSFLRSDRDAPRGHDRPP
ncbi:phage virion morphogenesis protein [Oleomonas cavernae]|uniref:Phage virion morphogenesis protein n=1 Tax=Oleomonas cavernae TaxID=2320859 RepID=A0A418WU74_9PROT|nr:phage virion morphogenesis protein [Oleomonas cavernae]RJF94812.1 phage virion morphogenesis protein [Oleomonas cavernae]